MEKVFYVTVTASLFVCIWGSVHSYDPTPNPKSVVVVGEARFTVLTSRLIRMEYGAAVDSPTITFINRNLPAPTYKRSKNGDWYTIQTSDLTVSPTVLLRGYTLYTHVL